MKKRCSPNRRGHFWVHECDDPFGCAVASLLPTYRRPAPFPPGARVRWEDRTGVVWDAAPGNARSVVPDVPRESEAKWGLARVPVSALAGELS